MFGGELSATKSVWGRVLRPAALGTPAALGRRKSGERERAARGRRCHGRPPGTSGAFRRDAKRGRPKRRRAGRPHSASEDAKKVRRRQRARALELRTCKVAENESDEMSPWRGDKRAAAAGDPPFVPAAAAPP
ncbi:hypothetical protein HPB50_004433 [Hyalomma asiaticum]|uniref:Uncharacterized protein n=1 Tax=Hyalomma asiaticum TaxID=266040 RepID=A0ACB7TBY8_HYAAI|nr:hypothetical protein HPB50_004433 [Hyalomma asiaticum]